ncbi:hypothetical protein SBF1_7510002 [Candidatus Desulfosporosinus infrequens]|uniref:Uncharacterized protein n=1 Tax=Candidatus Desulfosporosinus infrequens TaxID=2043169 RepID=A0A2U3LR72_9FIRM|nr:hypothetical protein SBF1_7510002 [Candidatus Desulfosporosinus infrequens]
MTSCRFYQDSKQVRILVYNKAYNNKRIGIVKRVKLGVNKDTVIIVGKSASSQTA